MPGKELVSLIQLIATPELFHEQRIAVIGFFVVKHEAQGIFLAESDYRNGASKNALWFAGTLNPEFVQFHERYALVEGIFDMTNKGHLQFYSGAIRDLTRVLPRGLSS
jgi:hypothetical protein